MTEREIRTDTENADEYSDDELEDAWKYYIKKVVNNEHEGIDFLHLDALEAEMGRRDWKIRVTEDEQDVIRGDE